jgi:hypothetical protein
MESFWKPWTVTDIGGISCSLFNFVLDFLEQSALKTSEQDVFFETSSYHIHKCLLH